MPQPPRPSDDPTSPSPDRALRLAVCSWSLRPSDPEDLASQVRACGLDAVQLALTPLAEDPERWGASSARLRAAGIEVESGMLATVGEDYSTIDSIARTGGVRPDATWPATRTRAERVAAIASELGVGLVTFHAGFLPHERAAPERRTMLERLGEIVEIFRRVGADVAFETGQEPAAVLVECLRELDAAGVRAGVNLDPANMLLYGSGNPVEAARLLAPWIRQVHIKDALPSPSPGTWGREVPVGSGAVDWSAFLAVVRALVPKPALVIEREAGPSRIADIRRAVEVVRSACAAAARH